MLEVTRANEKPVAVRIGQQDFECDETGDITVPKVFLRGFRLSDISDDIRIKPAEKIEGHSIHIKNDVALSQFSGGSAYAGVEEMFLRKLWDGDTGLSPHVAALRQSIAEEERASEVDFQDDGDCIFLGYSIMITEDLEIQEAIRTVDEAVDRIHTRADQLVSRKRDGLLNIFDRGSFESDLSHALSGKYPVTLIMADINHFKQINDTFGHFVGDEVLRAVARILVSKCDGGNRVPYRYGGDELAVILTGADAAKGVEITESLRADIEQIRLDAHPELKPTISLGIAASDVSRNRTELVKSADAAMYLEKQKGRKPVLSKWLSLTRNRKVLFVATVGVLGVILWFGIRTTIPHDVRKPPQNAVTETSGTQDSVKVEVHHPPKDTVAARVNRAPVFPQPAPRPGARIPRGMTLTPASGDIEITFKPSPVLTQTIRNRIRRDLTRFQGYLVSLGIPVPIEVPPFGVQKDTRQLSTGTPAGVPVYRGALLLGEKVINDPTKATSLYAGYVVDRVLLDSNSPVRPAIGVSPHVSLPNLAELGILMGGLTAYLNESFWNRKDPENLLPLCQALWEMREKFGREFTDQMVRYALQAMNDSPPKDTRVHMDSYFVAMLKIGDSVVDDNVMSHWTTATGILEKYGLSDDTAAPKPNQQQVTPPQITQNGKENIAQMGNNNTATITATIPFRTLSEDQRQEIAAFLKTVPPSVLVSVGGVYGSADAVNYANEFLPLFEKRHLNNQSAAAIRTGFPITFTDVFVATTSEDDSARKYRDEFVRELNSLGIPARSANGTNIPPGNLELLVGFRPEEVKR